jgi:hypothetical protein
MSTGQAEYYSSPSNSNFLDLTDDTLRSLVSLAAVVINSIMLLVFFMVYRLKSNDQAVATEQVARALEASVDEDEMRMLVKYQRQAQAEELELAELRDRQRRSSMNGSNWTGEPSAEPSQNISMQDSNAPIVAGLDQHRSSFFFSNPASMERLSMQNKRASFSKSMRKIHRRNSFRSGNTPILNAATLSRANTSNNDIIINVAQAEREQEEADYNVSRDMVAASQTSQEEAAAAAAAAAAARHEFGSDSDDGKYSDSGNYDGRTQRGRFQYADDSQSDLDASEDEMLEHPIAHFFMDISIPAELSFPFIEENLELADLLLLSATELRQLLPHEVHRDVLSKVLQERIRKMQGGESDDGADAGPADHEQNS